MNEYRSEIDPAANRPSEDTDFREQESAAARFPGPWSLVSHCWAGLNDVLRLRADKSSWRIRLVALGFAILYLVIGFRLAYLGSEGGAPQTLKEAASDVMSEA